MKGNLSNKLRSCQLIKAPGINLKVNLSILSNESQIIENKEFTMSNIQQMNLIGFYYHGYVSLHIVSSQGSMELPQSLLEN